MTKEISFSEKLLTLISLLVALSILGFGVYSLFVVEEQAASKISSSLSLALIGAVFAAVVLIFGSIRVGLAKIDKRVDLHVRHDESMGRLLSEIIRLLPEKSTVVRKEVKKRLNGIYRNMTSEGIESPVEESILKRLKTAISVYAASTFPVEWWFQPEGVFYLAKQVVEITKNHNVSLERYTLYTKDTYFDEYKSEFKALYDVHTRTGRAKFFMLDSSEVDSRRDEIIEKMFDTVEQKEAQEDKKKLRKYIRNYYARSKKLYADGFMPDGIVVDDGKNEERVGYERIPENGRLHSGDYSTIRLYIQFLKTAYDNFEDCRVPVEQL